MNFVFMLIFLFLIIPLIFEINLLIDLNDKKIYLAIYIFKYIKVISGYLTLVKGYIAFHIKNKAYLISPKSIINTGKKYKKIKHFEIFYLKSSLFLSDINDFILYFIFIYNFLMENFSKIYKMNKNFSLIKNDIILNQNDQKLKYFLRVKIAFNMIVILIITIKKLMENIINAKKSRKRWENNW